MMQRCIVVHRDAERCREVQRCRGAEMVQRGAERCRDGAEMMQRCRGAEVQRWCSDVGVCVGAGLGVGA